MNTYCEHCKAWYDEKGKKIEDEPEIVLPVAKPVNKTSKRILG